jgi:hypothetical protein
VVRSVMERLLAKVVVDGVTGCWNWTASQNGRGYGQINVDGRPRPSHRISYSVHRGKISDGLFVCHHCDNPLCINPDHLFLGTAADNAADRHSKGRSIIHSGSNHGSAKLTEADVVAIRASKASQDILGAQYGVSGAQICRIRNGKQRRSG